MRPKVKKLSNNAFSFPSEQPGLNFLCSQEIAPSTFHLILFKVILFFPPFFLFKTKKSVKKEYLLKSQRDDLILKRKFSLRKT
jgi:hypothetical protein